MFVFLKFCLYYITLFLDIAFSVLKNVFWYLQYMLLHYTRKVDSQQIEAFLFLLFSSFQVQLSVTDYTRVSSPFVVWCGGLLLTDYVQVSFRFPGCRFGNVHVCMHVFTSKDEIVLVVLDFQYKILVATPPQLWHSPQ